MQANSSAVTTVRMSATLTYVPIEACAPGAGFGSFMGGSRDQVDQGEDRDPHDVHEVPVEPGDLHLDRVGDAEPAAEVEDPEGEQPDHADRHVGAVEAGEDEEGGPEQVPLERQSLAGEVRELVPLEAEEDEAEERDAEEPEPPRAPA